MIDAEEISKSYDGKQALKSVSLEVGEGEVIGLIGPNGAGKSTVMQVLTGQLPRDGGEAQVLGQDPENDPEGLREKLGILPEREDPPSFLTGNEYLEFVSDVRGAEIDKQHWVDTMDLEGKMEKQTRLLSKGERQKLMFVQALFHDPDALFIDEPMINLDPRIQERVKQQINEYARQGRGRTALYTCHSVGRGALQQGLRGRGRPDSGGAVGRRRGPVRGVLRSTSSVGCCWRSGDSSPRSSVAEGSRSSRRWYSCFLWDSRSPP